ncbi:MAG: prolyl oligopeptidase family serine peptidase [Planctomycetales bacterium]|nr:prolyl oligopeptidase family serine peptidase [Planctomycetales bacterium]
MRHRTVYIHSVFVLLFIPQIASADGPADNIPAQVRPVPPVGIELSSANRAELEQGLHELNAAIAPLRASKDPRVAELLPDIEIYARAVRQGIAYREFYSERNVQDAKAELKEGLARATALTAGKPYWTTQKGLVVRGYRSRLDETVQPYGLEIPDSYTFDGKSPYRLDLWFHGRGERSTEPVFIAERTNRQGRYAPRDTIVLHPYGRYSNSFKFAGEVDVFEALEHAQRHYRIDEDRISVRGFSMGGAGCWQMAVHYADRFFAANPGAGFSETPEFLKSFQQETLKPTWYEKTLWQMYDCPVYVNNLRQLPTVAYSGELDIQKQAADVMEAALSEKGMSLMHVIGPQTKHAIHPDSATIIEAKLDSLARQGRERTPREVWLDTPTLKYNRMHWLTVTQLGEHWKPAHVHARLLQDDSWQGIVVETTNVRGLRFHFDAGEWPFRFDKKIGLIIDDQPGEVRNSESLRNLFVQTDRSFDCEVHFDGEQWVLGPPADGLRKKHDLQGPIDDGFMDSFLVVRPGGKARHEAVDQWTHSELDHFLREWRRQFRGDALVKLDAEISEADIATKHLILFGDPASNRLLASIADKLPIAWGEDRITVGAQSFDAAHHAPALIYPNPLNPKRYVVLNSGFTYREYAYLNNARQVPKLPDWAIFDLRTPPDALWPGKVAAADFFDEQWRLKPLHQD